jgi:hypothetical protein
MMRINKSSGLEYDDVIYNAANRKKILWLGDDCRMHSGIATMSREIILGTCHKYNYCQIAGAITHPEKGKVVDMSPATIAATGVKDAYVKLYPVDGYGNEDTLFTIIAMEKPDAIMHFTDPRYWGWLYILEKQIRSKIPITYYTIWDDIPYPQYNHPYYESCDLLMPISKQTANICKWVLGPKKCFSLEGNFDEKTGEEIPFVKTDIKKEVE